MVEVNRVHNEEAKNNFSNSWIISKQRAQFMDNLWQNIDNPGRTMGNRRLILGRAWIIRGEHGQSGKLVKQSRTILDKTWIIQEWYGAIHEQSMVNSWQFMGNPGQFLTIHGQSGTINEKSINYKEGKNTKPRRPGKWTHIFIHVVHGSVNLGYILPTGEIWCHKYLTAPNWWRKVIF